MSGLSTGYRHVRRAGHQGTRPPVLSQAGVEKYATGCGNFSMPSIPLERLNTTQNQIKKNAKIKTVNNKKQFSIGTINLRTAKKSYNLLNNAMHVKNIKNGVCLFQETHKTGNDGIDFEDPMLKGWRVIHSGLKKNAQAGVAIVCALHVTVEDEERSLCHC